MKMWIEGHLISTGYVVTYEEDGKKRKIEFPTEEEAQEYFKEESQKWIRKKVLRIN